MSVVMLYGFTGVYSGDPEYDWDHPELGAVHKCMLFLRQKSESDDFLSAEFECRRYGFTDIHSIRVGKLQVEALNTDLYRGFAGFYEEALKEGSAFVFYPTKVTGSGSAA